jgi:hypothetical protein
MEWTATGLRRYFVRFGKPISRRGLMSVLSHLTNTASAAVLSSNETSSINTSVSNLQSKIISWFGTDISEHFKFGSYTRETILPRKIDENSDVDYMLVFKDSSSKPQTYLDRLRRFVEAKYAHSEIKQSHPTIVLELSHIKFELVPAIHIYGGYNIPAPTSNWSDWAPTYPNAFNSTLTERNKQHGYNLKPLIRLVKYWNAQVGYVFNSFGLEEYLVSYAGIQLTLKEYFYWGIESLTLSWNEAQWRREKLDRAKQIVRNTRTYEQLGLTTEAENEIKKLIPPV